MPKTLTDLFATAAEQSVESIAEWGGGAQKPCPCCKGTGEHDEGECQLCDGGMTVSEHTPDDAQGKDCFHTGSVKTAAPAEESQYSPAPMGRPDENRYTADQGVHRGMSVVLSPEVHKFVHDPAQPPAAKAHLLLSEVRKQNAKNQGPEGEEGSTGGLGNYWTPSKDKAAEYANQTGWETYKDHEREHNCGDPDYGDGGCPTTHVVLHADTPPEKHHWNETFRPGEQYDPQISWRLPVRPGAPLNVRGVSWREGNDHLPSEQRYSEEGMKFHTSTPFSRYDFAHPVRKKATVDNIRPEHNGGELPSDWLKLNGRTVHADTEGSPHVELVPTHQLRQYATQEVDPQHAKEVASQVLTNGYMKPLVLQYHPKSGEAYLGEGNHRLFLARKLGISHVPVRVTRNNYGLAGNGAPVPQDHPAVSAGTHVPSDIRPSELGFQTLTPRGRTSKITFGPGADVGHIGEDSYEEDPGYSRKMWDQWHPKLQPEIHRHLGVEFPSGHPAHDESLPLEDRARAVVQHVSNGEYGRGGVGVHWTDDQNYQHLTGARAVPGETPVVLHAKTPPREHVEDNDYVLEDRAVRDWDTEEREVPLKRRAPVQITGVTWRTHRGPVRYNFHEPIVRQAASTPPGTMGTDSEGHQVQMTTMDGWAHDDGSHGHEDNSTIGDKPVYTHTHTWLPEGRYWGPNSAQNDQRVFDGDHLRPEIRQDILDRVGRVLGHLYKGWEKWAKVYFAGSEAAKWQPFNGDFDVLIGIDWPEFFEANPEDEELDEAEVAQQMTDALWSKANVDNFYFDLADGRKVGPFDRTFFVNPRAWDIRALKPYAAYNVTDDTWAVHPLEVPKDWNARSLPESYWDYAEAVLNEIKAIGQLPAEERQRMAANLYEELHTHRSDAFGDQGKGMYDLSNVIEKYLDQHPDQPWAKLKQWRKESPTGAGPWLPTTGRMAKIMPGADSDGIMIAIVPPKKVGRALLEQVEDGEPLEALHVTLCYLGSKGEHRRGQVNALGSLVRAWARTQKPFTAKVGGAGTFVNPGQHVLMAHVDIPGGGEIRESLNKLLQEHDYKVRNDHGWTPHITLKYHTSHVRFLPKIEPESWDVTEIMLCIGGTWEPIKLGS